MIIPKHLLWNPNMTEKDRRFMVNFVKKERERMKSAPVYESEDAATKAAVQALKRGVVMPSVWKEPKDIGQKYAVVEYSGLRERAYNGGYTEVVDEKKIFDLANGRIDEIEEV